MKLVTLVNDIALKITIVTRGCSSLGLVVKFTAIYSQKKSQIPKYSQI